MGSDVKQNGTFQGTGRACAKARNRKTACNVHVVQNGLRNILRMSEERWGCYPALFLFLDSPLPLAPSQSMAPSLYPTFFFSLHRCDLLGAKLLSLSDLHRELLMQVPHGKLGAIFYLETFQPYTADPATAACFITHHGDVWMEINGFFTLFPRQICPAVGSLGE